MKTLNTIKNLHNFHFRKTDFFSPKLEKRSIYLKQISFDTPSSPDTYFAIDKDTLELFIYFDNMGTKLNPRLLKIGYIPENYQTAILKLSAIENSMLSIINNMAFADLKDIKTGAEMNKQIDCFPENYLV